MKLRIIISLLFLASNFSVFAQLKSYQFEDIEALQKQNEKPVFIFIYTNWCTYCVAMKVKVFNDSKVVELLNKQFYFIWLNAEEERKIIFNKQQFNFKPSGIKAGMHQLAAELATIEKELTFPSFSILNPANEIIYQKRDFTSAKELTIILAKISSGKVN
jgi:thioredoxin-related protein